MNFPLVHKAVACLPVVACLVGPAAAQAQETVFDGAWSVVMTCPAHNAADDDAKGYTHRFPAEIQNGRMRATHGKPGEPGWHYLHGKINLDGSAVLRLDGIVSNAKYAIHDAERGKEYTYRVKAQLQPNSGVGQRLTGRVCEFAFSR
ncbi:hypothetical protein ASF43_11470 [Pseudorhodoferax sp. Leaf267]|nr:hypothetical protein ASF43_11470 [Pseudorhodoferax sp. Leaf267]